MSYEIIAKNFVDFKYKYDRLVESGKILLNSLEQNHRDNIKPLLKQKQNEKEYFGPEVGQKTVYDKTQNSTT